MCSLNIETTQTTTKTTSILLTGKDLLCILKNVSPDLAQLIDAPGASITVQVEIPHGGDYSGGPLEIDHTCPVYVEIKTQE